MDKNAKDTFAVDLENRLDDFFSDALPLGEHPPARGAVAPPADSPLKALKSTVLAIDWEITDEVLMGFLHQVDQLMRLWRTDKIANTLLKILNSLGKYIRLHKSKAHPDTIKRIMAVFGVLETVITDETRSRKEKEKMALEEVKQFKRLKAQIVKPGVRPPSVDRPQPAPAAVPPASTDLEGLIDAIEALKTRVTAELSAIQSNLERMGKGR